MTASIITYCCTKAVPKTHQYNKEALPRDRTPTMYHSNYTPRCLVLCIGTATIVKAIQSK